MHLPGMDTAGSNGHDFAHARPVLVEEDPAREVHFVVIFAQHVVETLDRVWVAFQFAHHRARVNMVDTGEPHPFRNHPERNTV